MPEKKQNNSQKNSNKKNKKNDEIKLVENKGIHLTENSKQKMNPNVEKEIETMKTTIEEFKNKVIDKFKDYVHGISLLPPSKDEKNKENKTHINLLILIDDSDSKKMSKQELKEKLTEIITKIAKEVNERLSPIVILLTEVWQSCYDGKYEILDMIATGVEIYDTGMLGSLKIAQIHKTMVVKKFERYIVTYVLSGSLTQGKATKKSDVDVFIVIDDTDVRRMTRGELKEKLRAIIIGMGIEAGEMTGLVNKINIQVYILTEFWESLRDANPVIFTLLRHGIPLHDRGIFMPWKQLLEMGKIKPSPEAIDMFMDSGDKILQRVTDKIKDIGIEDIYYALLTPSQAVLMQYGLAPPTPRETPVLMKEIFVDKEKLLKNEDLKILDEIIKLRKQVEHQEKSEINGKEIDEFLNQGKKYLETLKRLFKKIEERKNKEIAEEIQDNTKTFIKKVLSHEGVKFKDETLLAAFNETFIVNGKIPDKYYKKIQTLLSLESKESISKTELYNYQTNANEIITFLRDYLEKSKFFEMEKSKIKIYYSDEKTTDSKSKKGKDNAESSSKKIAEVYITEKEIYLIKESNGKKEFYLSENKDEWKLKKISYDELNQKLRDDNTKFLTELDQRTIRNLTELFGKDCKIVLS